MIVKRRACNYMVDEKNREYTKQLLNCEYKNTQMICIGLDYSCKKVLAYPCCSTKGVEGVKEVTINPFSDNYLLEIEKSLSDLALGEHPSCVSNLYAGLDTPCNYHPRKIRSLDINLNSLCNYKCKMCCVAEDKNKDIAFRNLVQEKLYHSLKGYGLNVLKADCGGEPMLSKPLLDFLNSATKEDFLTWSVFTNGTTNVDLLLSTSEYLISQGINVRVTVSCCGFSESSYTDIIGGNFGKLETVLETCKSLKKMNALKAINCVVSDYNIDNIYKELDIALNLPDGLSDFLMFCPIYEINDFNKSFTNILRKHTIRVMNNRRTWLNDYKE